jgi:hypothetical protein
MKPNSVIVFLGQRYELCKAFGLFGKDNLVYQSEFDHRVYKNSKYAKYYFEKLNADVVFISSNGSIDELDLIPYDNMIIVVSENDIYNQKHIFYRTKYPHCKLVFLWMYGEVFSKSLLEHCKKSNLDLLISGSNQPGLTDIGIFDYKLNFKYFYYYIGYYYLTSLVSNLENKSYDVNQLPIFTYAKTAKDSTWRSDILNDLHSKFPNKIYSGISINDSYDLEFTKYKHFETINDYSYRNYNLIFETIDYRNNMEYFATEKTFKGLFFNNPFYLVAPTDMINELSKDFYLLNSSFYNLDSFVGSENLAKEFDDYKSMSKMNLSKLLEYIHDYSYIEHFKKLLN